MTVLGTIKIENIRIYAHHGCLKEETAIGSDYRVDISISADLSKAASSDDLKQTIDYVHLNHIVAEEMKIPSRLLEHVAQRIGQRIFTELPMAQKSKVCIAKLNPPIGGDVELVSINLKFIR